MYNPYEPNRAFTVTQINQYIKFLFEKDYALNNINVKGEISNFKHHSSGHMYFTVKDENSSLSCVMFKAMAEYLEFEPENGMSVAVGGRISVYEKTGQYQLYADSIQLCGKGNLHIAFELLKQKLFDEGLFEQSHKKAIPKYPNTIGIITSPTGAAIRDIIQISKRRNPTIKLVISPVKVQGENSANDIVKAIEYMNQWGKADILIVGRGGGSIEDLWSFNEEIVAKAIYKSKIPIISAVGHEIDYTIADFVADLRAPTPSAAAEIAVPNLDDLKSILHVDSQYIQNSVISKIQNAKSEIESFKNRIISPAKYIEASRLHLLELKKYMNRDIQSVLYKNKQKLIHSSEKIEAVSPLSILKRGYSIVYNQNKTISSIDSVKENDILKVQLNDGYIYTKVESKEKSYAQKKTTVI